MNYSFLNFQLIIQEGITVSVLSFIAKLRDNTVPLLVFVFFAVQTTRRRVKNADLL